MTQSRSRGLFSFSGGSMPGSTRVGRTLAYWSKLWQMFRRRPHSVMSSGNVGRAHRTEVDRVERLELFEPVGRHHAAVLLVVVAAPVELLDLQLERAFAAGQRSQHLDAGVDDFRADPVAADGSYLVRLHSARPSFWARPMRCSLPVAPLGISSRKTTVRGTLKGAGAAPANSRNSFSVACRAFRKHHGGGDILAQLGVRHREGDDLRTAGWSMSTSSTSRGEIFSPPRLMISLSRPVMDR